MLFVGCVGSVAGMEQGRYGLCIWLPEIPLYVEIFLAKDLGASVFHL